MTWLDTFKTAIKEVFHKNPAGLKEAAIADRMGMPRTFLYRYGDLHQEAIIPVERLVQLTLICGHVGPIDALCRACGGIFIPVRPIARQYEQETVHALRDFSDLLQESAQDYLDGNITTAELKAIENKAYQAQMAIAALVEAARQRHGKTEGGEGEGGI